MLTFKRLLIAVCTLLCITALLFPSAFSQNTSGGIGSDTRLDLKVINDQNINLDSLNFEVEKSILPQGGTQTFILGPITGVEKQEEFINLECEIIISKTDGEFELTLSSKTDKNGSCKISTDQNPSDIGFSVNNLGLFNSLTNNAGKFQAFGTAVYRQEKYFSQIQNFEVRQKKPPEATVDLFSDRITVGTPSQTRVTIRNQNDFDITDVQVEIKITTDNAFFVCDDIKSGKYQITSSLRSAGEIEAELECDDNKKIKVFLKTMLSGEEIYLSTELLPVAAGDIGFDVYNGENNKAVEGNVAENLPNEAEENFDRNFDSGSSSAAIESFYDFFESESSQPILALSSLTFTAISLLFIILSKTNKNKQEIKSKAPAYAKKLRNKKDNFGFK